MEKTQIKKIGQKLMKARKQGRLSQEEAAFKLGIHRTTLSHIENGKVSDLTLEFLLRASNVLNIPLLDLFDFEADQMAGMFNNISIWRKAADVNPNPMLLIKPDGTMVAINEAMKKVIALDDFSHIQAIDLMRYIAPSVDYRNDAETQLYEPSVPTFKNSRFELVKFKKGTITMTDIPSSGGYLFQVALTGKL